MEEIFHSLIANSSTDLRQIRNYKDKFSSEFESECIDIIWTFDNFHYPAGHPNRKQFVDLVQRIIDGRLLAERLLKERLDIELLSQVKVVSDQEGLQKRIVRSNTTLFYKQNKFNLLRESLVGYSQFFTSLFTNEIQLNSTISHYSLDPNCCLEMLIDFTCTDITANYPKLKIFLSHHYTNPLNFSLVLLKKEENFENEANRSNLMKLVCFLIRDGFLQISDIIDSKLVEKSKNGTMSVDSFDRHPSLVLVVYHLIDIGLINKAIQLFPLIPNLFEYKMICKRMCEFLYTNLCASRVELFGDWFTNELPGLFFSSYPDFLSKIVYFLKYCPLIHFPPLLLVLLKIANWAIRKDEGQKEFWFFILKEYLLSQIMALSIPFPPLMDELGQFLFNFDYKTRFYIYNEMKSAPSGDVLTQTRKALRRLSVETVKVIGKSLCKLACLRPLAVFGCCLDQIQAYDNMITPIIDSFKYLYPIEYDILTFTLIEALANQTKDQLKSDSINLSDWLQNLALFSGIVCKKYQWMNLEGLFNFLLSRLSAKNLLFLYMFDELIHKMTGHESSSSIPDSQLEVLSAGPVLCSLIGNGNFKKSLGRFKTSLKTGGLVQQLFVLIAYQLNSFNFDNLKLIGNITDKSKQILIHLKEIFTTEELKSFKIGKKYFGIQSKDSTLMSTIDELFSTSSLSQIHLPDEIYKNEIQKATNDGNIKLLSLLEAERTEILHSIEKFFTFLSSNPLSQSFTSNLLLERCLNSTIDSFFCVKFIQSLNNFNPIETFEIVKSFLKTFPLLISMTEGEVNNYARFYHCCLSVVVPKECLFEVGNEILFKIISLIESDEFIVIRNCILFLRFLLGIFPMIAEQASLLEHCLNKHRNDSRSDIKVLANSYLSLLISGRNRLVSSTELSGISLDRLKEALENCLREKVLSSMTDSLEIGECVEEEEADKEMEIVVDNTTDSTDRKRKSIEQKEKRETGKRKFIDEEEKGESKRYRQSSHEKDNSHSHSERHSSRRNTSSRHNKY